MNIKSGLRLSARGMTSHRLLTGAALPILGGSFRGVPSCNYSTLPASRVTTTFGPRGGNLARVAYHPSTVLTRSYSTTQPNSGKNGQGAENFEKEEAVFNSVYGAYCYSNQTHENRFRFFAGLFSKSLLVSGLLFSSFLTYLTYQTFTNSGSVSYLGTQAWQQIHADVDMKMSAEAGEGVLGEHQQSNFGGYDGTNIQEAIDRHHGKESSTQSQQSKKEIREFIRENMERFSEPNQLYSDILAKNYIYADALPPHSPNHKGEGFDEPASINGFSLDSNINDKYNNTPPIYRIVLTGGPCAGKSTAMETLRTRLNSIGFQVLTLPELATMFIGSGVKFPQFVPMTSDQILELQSCMVHAQMSLEDVYYRLAKSSGEPTLILCDRGIIDGRAYMTPLEFQVMLDTNDWNLMQLRDQRYDCVIHLVSAAIGAEDFYTLENNKARSESLYQAQMIDKKLREVYIGHPYLFVVNNQTGFEEKIEKVVNIVGSIIGMPKKIASRRKFLLKDDAKDSEITVPFEKIDVEHVFLRSDDPNEQCGIRKRTHQYVNSYSIVHKIKTKDGNEETNVFRRLTPKTYMQFMKQADPSRRKTKKIQKSFVWGDHYYVLNRYKLKTQPDVNLLVVEARQEEEADTLIPDFLKDRVIREVTPADGEADRFGLHHFAYDDRPASEKNEQTL